MGSGIMMCCNGVIFSRHSRIVSAAFEPPISGGGGGGGLSLRWKVLEQLDKELSKGDERAALNLVKDLQGKPGGLRCFGAARQIPQRLYTLDELRLNGIETASLLAPVDSTLGSIERNLQIAVLLGGIAAWNVFGLSPQQILFSSLGLLFLWTLDAVSFNGGVSFLVLDTIGHSISQKYHNRVVQHEAGHFLIAYLLGILPRGFTLTSLEALKKEGSLNVQAGTAFVDFEFLEEVSKGKVSATTLNRFTCIALAGVATEYLLFGYAEGGLADINTLDRLLNSLGFTQKKADSQVRWAVLNTILILRRHEKTRAMLADAMSKGSSWLLGAYNTQILIMMFLAFVSLLLAGFFAYHAKLCLTNTTTNESFKWQEHLSWQRKVSEAKASAEALKASLDELGLKRKPQERKWKSFFRTSRLEELEVVKNNIYDLEFLNNIFDVLSFPSQQGSRF